MSKYRNLGKILVFSLLQTSSTTFRNLKAITTTTFSGCFNAGFNGNDGTEEKLSKYWQPNRPIEEIFKEADDLYKHEKFIQAYEMLNRLKYHNNSDVKWRIARVLYKTTTIHKLPIEIKKEIIREAYELLLEDATEDNLNPNVHKWFAIICDLHHSSNLEKRVQSYHIVLKHLRKAFELNPKDLTVCYLLGKLCFTMANLKGLRRFIARAMYAEPPSCTYEEAYQYLHKFEQLNEGTFLISNFLLAKCCIELKQYYKAKHYLTKTCYMTPKTEIEYKCHCKAKNLLVEMEKYTLGKEILFPRL